MAATISASQFKARCLGLIDQVAATGEVLVITKTEVILLDTHVNMYVCRMGGEMSAPGALSRRHSQPFNPPPPKVPRSTVPGLHSIGVGCGGCWRGGIGTQQQGIEPGFDSGEPFVFFH